MKAFKPWHTLLLGFAGGLVVCHLYHTKTNGPGTIPSASKGR
jgi:hypothetical protein